LISVEFCQASGSVSVVETTYFCRPFMVAASGSSAACSGQKAAKMSYVRRPSRSPSFAAKASIFVLPKMSSK